MSYNYDMCAFRLSCFKIDNGKSIWNVNGFHSFPCTWLNAARWRAASTRRDACITRTERIKRFMDEPFWSLPRLALKDQESRIFELRIMEVIKVNKWEWIQFCISRIKAYMNFSAFVLSIWSLCSYLNIVAFYKIIILAILMWYACGISFPSQTKDTSVWRCTCLAISGDDFSRAFGTLLNEWNFLNTTGEALAVFLMVNLVFPGTGLIFNPPPLDNPWEQIHALLLLSNVFYW